MEGAFRGLGFRHPRDGEREEEKKQEEEEKGAGGMGKGKGAGGNPFISAALAKPLTCFPPPPMMDRWSLV
jgi:hypothetical protein